MTSTALVSLAPTTLPEAESFSLTIAKSSLLPPALRGKPADVLLVVLTGQELGISPLQAIRGVHIVQGKPVLAADLIIALCMKHPDCRYFHLDESTPERATYSTLRAGHPEPTRMTWTMEDARRAKLTGKDNWTNHPAAMLRARCAAALARVVFPDILFGTYLPDEAEEFRGGPKAPPIEAMDAVVVDEPPSAAIPEPGADDPDNHVMPPWAATADDIEADLLQRCKDPVAWDACMTAIASIQPTPGDAPALQDKAGDRRHQLTDIAVTTAVDLLSTAGAEDFETWRKVLNDHRAGMTTGQKAAITRAVNGTRARLNPPREDAGADG